MAELRRMAGNIERQYEIVVYGATGYTGEYIAEYLQEHGPNDLRWAIAGRSSSKVDKLLSALARITSKSQLPAKEIVQHNQEDLERLTSKAGVLISAVGPYVKYGTPVVAACVKTSTHYLDITGETIWVSEIIAKFHEKAKKDGTVIMPHSGIESVPSDILTYLLVDYARKHYGEGVKDCINSTQEMKLIMSGGSIDSAMTMMQTYPLAELAKIADPFYLSPIPPNPSQKRAPRGTGGILSGLLGYTTVPDLGVLTDWPGNAVDSAIVHRSWALFDRGAKYGHQFRFAQLFKARNALQGILQAWTFRALSIMLLVPFGRWLLRRYGGRAPGEGPPREDGDRMAVRYKALAVTDETERRIVAEVGMKGSMYYWTAVLVAECALEVARGNPSAALARHEAGVVTPATLEMGLVKRLAGAGFRVQITPLPQTAIRP